MGPRLMSRGKKRKVTVVHLQGDSFNGAAAHEPRKVRASQVLIIHDFTSCLASAEAFA